MNTFPFETRHRDHQMVTFEDTNHIALKFLTTQLPKFMDWERVYPFIANDLEAIKFRAPGILADFANFREVSPEELQSLLESAKETKIPIINDYCEKVKPPKGKEVLAFFIHGQCKKNLASHVEALTDDVKERQRLIKAIREYVPPEPLREGMTSNVGLFLSNLKVNAPIIIQEEEAEEDEEEEEEEDNVGDDLVILSTPDAKEWKEEEHWENPILAAFKADAGLSTQFSCSKAAKQILVKNCGSSSSVNDRSIMGKFQSEIPAADFHEEHYPPFHLVDSLPSETVEEIIKHPSAQRAYHSLLHKPKDNREWIKAMIRVASNVPMETHRRFDLTGTKLDADIIEKIKNV